jgi:hypothetical protein
VGLITTLVKMNVRPARQHRPGPGQVLAGKVVSRGNIGFGHMCKKCNIMK